MPDAPQRLALKPSAFVMYTRTPIEMYKMRLAIACLAMDGAYCAAAAWVWASISSAQGDSLLDVNIEGEECTRWIFDGDTVLVVSLVGGR